VTAGSHPHGSGLECRAMLERLSDYLDGDLPADLCERYDAHIRDCEPCVRFVESLRRAVRWLGTEGGESIPDDLRREILAAGRKLRGS